MSPISGFGSLRKPKNVAIQILQILAIISITLFVIDLSSDHKGQKKDATVIKPATPNTGHLLESNHAPKINQSIPSKPILENAAIVFLARNREVYGILSSMQNIEDRFNRHRGYPYIFLNDEPFSEEFKE